MCFSEQMPPKQKIVISEDDRLSSQFHPTLNTSINMTDKMTRNTKVWWKCLSGHSVRMTISRREKYGCPSCTKMTCVSHGEWLVAQTLGRLKIPYTIEQTYAGCRDTRVLRFDFEIQVSGRTPAVIEFDGVQHFEMGERGVLRDRQRKDRIKDNYCRENRISMLRISHQEIHDVEHWVRRFYDAVQRDYTLMYSNERLYSRERSLLDMISSLFHRLFV